jgi:hypothetical protein
VEETFPAGRSGGICSSDGVLVTKCELKKGSLKGRLGHLFIYAIVMNKIRMNPLARDRIEYFSITSSDFM